MKNDFVFPLLLADIGGTNCRVGLLATPDAEPARLGRLQTQAFGPIENAIADLVERSKGPRPRAALVAAAGPVTGTRVEITNAAQEFDAGALGVRLELASSAIINDFVAQAAAIPRLKPHDSIALQSGAADPRGARLAIGPGTGFGVGFIVRGGDGLAVIASEGGHAGLGPESEAEQRLWPHLERVEGRITIESVVSGAGLSRLDQAIGLAEGAQPERRSPSIVVDLTLSRQDARAAAAVELFLALLARAAGDLALTAKATGGVFICGGIAPRLVPLINPQRFCAAFADRAPMQRMLAGMPVMIVTAEEPAFLGLAELADPSSPLDAPEMTVWRP
ncbi:MAG: glucokinase [Beijerinckiaceae bacterium]